MSWKTRNNPNRPGFGEHYLEEEKEYQYGAKRRASGSAQKPQPRSVHSMKKPESPQYKKGFEKGSQEAAMGSYRTWEKQPEEWRKGYNDGWRAAFKKPVYDEVVLINSEEDFTAWEKRRATMDSPEFQMWLTERMNIEPIPKNPYQAYQIDKSLKAKLKTKPEWAQRVNASDYQPVDYPPITKEPYPNISEPAPKTIAAEKKKEQLRARSRYLAEKMNVPEPQLLFTTEHQGRARSFYRSGYGRNRVTGEYVKVEEPKIVIGISGVGEKASPENYAVLAHEMGHHKTVVDIERKDGLQAVGRHYAYIRSSDKRTIDNEREAWANADPYLDYQRPSQRWLKTYAFGTYLGRTPGFKTTAEQRMAQ